MLQSSLTHLFEPAQPNAAGARVSPPAPRSSFRHTDVNSAKVGSVSVLRPVPARITRTAHATALAEMVEIGRLDLPEGPVGRRLCWRLRRVLL